MSEEASAPAAAVIEPLAPKPAKRSALFTDVDSAVDEALSKGKPAAKPRTGPPTKGERRQAEAEVDELLNDDAIGFRDADEPEEPEEDEPAPARRRKAEEPEEEEEAPKAKPKAPKPEAEPEEDEEPAPAREEGTKKKPHRRDDLPEDVFVEVKVDGEKHVVNLKELADGYSGQKAVAQRLAKLGEERATMQRHVAEARKEVQANGDYFAKLLRDPDRMYEVLTQSDEFEATLQKLFSRRYDDLTLWEKNPSARAKFLFDRNQRVIQNQQRQLEERQQALQNETRQRAVEKHRMEVIRPGYQEGLKRAGLIGQQVDHPDFVKTAQMWVDKRQQELGQAPITVDDVAKAVHMAARILGIKPQQPPPPKRPIIPAKEEQRRAKVSGKAPDGRSWEDIPRARRAMDPDYLMRGSRLRG